MFRWFDCSAQAAFTALWAFATCSALLGQEPVAKRALELHRSALVFDGHNDLPWQIRARGRFDLGRYDISQRLAFGHTDIPRLREGGVKAQFWSVFVPSSYAEEHRALHATLEQIDIVYRMVRRYRNDFELAYRAAEVERIVRSGKIACLIGIEGGHSIEESLAALKQVADMGLRAGKRLRGYVVTAFGCPYEGRVPIERVMRVIQAYAEMGVSEVSLGDTTGMANPRQVVEVFETVLDAAGGIAVAAHFHNSRGTGLANALAAYQAGIRIFDSSVGGIGGCPTAIGAMGNIATEDLVCMMEEMGVPTGVDFDSLLEAARFAQEVIGSELPSYTLKTGRPNWKGAGETDPG